ncbi:MAG: hypothetical protein HOI39_06505, partial [Flavobacteriales bacterium]|nr:hypothetical protein [Flavobacteriales bacterium]
MKKLLLILLCLPMIGFGQNTLLVPSQYSTIQSAINASVNGDTILVSDGTYNENITILAKSITIKSINGAGNTTINANGTVIFIQNTTDDVTIDGFTINSNSNGSGYANSAKCIAAEFSQVRIINNILNASSNNYQSTAVGVRLNDCDYSIISDNSMTSLLTVNGNYSASAWGIGMDDSDALISGNNIFSQVSGFGGQPAPAQGIHHWQGCNSQIFNNTIIAICPSYAEGISNTGQMRVYNNTIYVSSTNSSYVGKCIESWPNPEENNISIYGNILYGDGSRSQGLGVSDGPNVFADYNCSYNHGSTFPDDINNLLPGENNILSDPMFVNFNNYDFSLSGGSPCIDAGMTSDLYNDLDGSRNDMGSFGGSKININLNKLDFDIGTVSLAVTPQEQELIIYNGRDIDFIINNFTLLTQNFTISNLNTPLTIPPYSTHKINVQFSPQVLDSISDTLNIYSPNLFGNTFFQIELSGIGINESILHGNISDTLFQNQTYFITGDLIINGGDSLVIQDGVNLIFYPNVNFTVNGYLNAQGIEGNRIIFNKKESMENWGGILLTDSINDNSILDYLSIKNSSNYGMQISNANLNLNHVDISNTIPHPYWGEGGGGINIYNSTVNLLNCTVTENEIS